MSPLEFGTSWKEPQLQLVIAREVHQNPEPQHFWQDGLDPSQSQPCRSEPETMFNLIIFWVFDGFAIYHLEPTETEKILAGYHQDDWPWYETIEKHICQVKEKGLLYFRKPDVNHQEGQWPQVMCC
jgi:hypothetical protein